MPAAKRRQPFSAVMARYEAAPHKARLMAAARQQLGEALYSEEPDALAAIRLKAGLSQAKLATAAGTTQSHVARIEQGKTDPGTEMVSRLASALNVSETTVFQACRNKLQQRGGWPHAGT